MVVLQRTLVANERLFGFQLTFFRRQVRGVTIGGWLPLSLVSPCFQFAHFALTDAEAGQFRFAHRRSVRLFAGAATDRFHVWHGDWYARESNGRHRLCAHMQGVRLGLELLPLKGGTLHGFAGHYERTMDQPVCHVSISRLRADGVLTLDGRSFDVSGTAWMDREYGHCDFGPGFGGWDWMSIQLTDNRELMIYRTYDEERHYNGYQVVTLIDPDGVSTCLPGNDFQLTAKAHWTSPWTRTKYPRDWLLKVPRWDAELTIRPWLPHQELDTRGSTNIVYWEGASRVDGTLAGRPAKGNAYVELVGYNTLHRSIARSRIGLPGVGTAFVNNLRYHLQHRGCVRRLPSSDVQGRDGESR